MIGNAGAGIFGTWIAHIARVLHVAPRRLRAIGVGLALRTPAMVATSTDIPGIPGIAAMLGARPVYRVPGLPCRSAAVVGWGRRPSGRRAAKRAALSGARCLLLEDGFLRSMDRSDPPSSLVVDDVGLFSDAAAPSALERAIASGCTRAEARRAHDLAALWRSERLSKIAGLREWEGRLPAQYVLVADQVAGDASIACGGAGPETFDRMLDAALSEHPQAQVVVKRHPDSAAGRARGHYDAARLRAMPRVVVVDAPCHPARLLEGACAVYAVTSQLGFEALLWQRPVRVFGMPFYAGWGLTRDEMPPPPRRRPVSMGALVHAALVTYPRYLDPETERSCTPEQAFRRMGHARRHRLRFPPTVHALGFARWKRPILRRYLAGSEIRFVASADQVPKDGTLAVWGAGDTGGIRDGVRVVRVEDGFLRSVGLGADLTVPVSWILDDRGIHFDSAAPSRLEHLLATTVFDAALCERARALRQRVVEAGLSKYNLGGVPWTRPDGARRVVLVPGQVETDASLRFGAPGVRTDADLLAAVRRLEPEAHIVYKPHPDVVHGLRRKGSAPDPGDWDECLPHADTATLLGRVDAVHTVTSLTGFEALMRGTDVTCHGQPFYAGWGLTRDIHPPDRRARRLSLDALVAGTLLLYPTYVSPRTGAYITAEEAVDALLRLRDEGGSSATMLGTGLRRGARAAAGLGLNGR